MSKQGVRNSALFREVNERINGLSGAWRDGESGELLCECGDAQCTEAIAVIRADYDAARERPGRFLVAARHVNTAVTRVLSARDGYATVEYRESRD